jgi:hypothetical protein
MYVWMDSEVEFESVWAATMMMMMGGARRVKDWGIVRAFAAVICDYHRTDRP